MLKFPFEFVQEMGAGPTNHQIIQLGMAYELSNHRNLVVCPQFSGPSWHQPRPRAAVAAARAKRFVADRNSSIVAARAADRRRGPQGPWPNSLGRKNEIIISQWLI